VQGDPGEYIVGCLHTCINMYGLRWPYMTHSGTGIVRAWARFSRAYVQIWASISVDENIHGVQLIFLVGCRCFCCQDLLREPYVHIWAST